MTPRTREAIRSGFIVEFRENEERKKVFIPFMFNPIEIEDQEEINYNVQQIPGYADPLVQYVAGGGRLVSFNIYLEQERLNEYRWASKPNEQPTDVVRRLQEGERITSEVYVNRDIYSAFNQVTNVVKYTDLASISRIVSLEGVTNYIADNLDSYIEQIRNLILPQWDTEYIHKSPPTVIFLFGPSTIRGKIVQFNVRKIWFDNLLKTETAEISVQLRRFDPGKIRTFQNVRGSYSQIQYPNEEAMAITDLESARGSYNYP